MLKRVSSFVYGFSSLVLLVPCMVVLGLESSSASAQGRRRLPGDAPSVPLAIEAPARHFLFFKAHAVGTQNYICLPAAAGFAWKPIGPQATLFHTFTGDVRLQLATHFASANAWENGLPRPTWQHSFDSSRVWGRPIASSTDPAFVEPDAVPWLLLERAGYESGPAGGSLLTEARYIQRLNTSGGIAPWAGCAQAANVGSMAWVPYEADYLFYKAPGSH